MPTYITLMNWTGDGIGQVKDSAKRLDAGRKLFKKMGVKLKDTYLTMGRYDLVCVLEAADDETLAKAMLTLGSKGMTRSETLKAFPEGDYRKIIDAI